MEDYRALMAGFAAKAVRIGAAWPLIGIRGFSENEVRTIESNFGYALPAAYREFLLRMGRRAGTLFLDVAMTFESPEELLALKPEAIRSMESLGFQHPFGPETFVFGDYGGSQPSFFSCDGVTNDPETFNFEAGYLDQPESTGRFTELIRRFLDDYFPNR